MSRNILEEITVIVDFRLRWFLTVVCWEIARHATSLVSCWWFNFWNSRVCLRDHFKVLMIVPIALDNSKLLICVITIWILVFQLINKSISKNSLMKIIIWLIMGIKMIPQYYTQCNFFSNISKFFFSWKLSKNIGEVILISNKMYFKNNFLCVITNKMVFYIILYLWMANIFISKIYRIGSIM